MKTTKADRHKMRSDPLMRIMRGEGSDYILNHDLLDDIEELEVRCAELEEDLDFHVKALRRSIGREAWQSEMLERADGYMRRCCCDSMYKEADEFEADLKKGPEYEDCN